jgi:hypothetical protein
MADGRDNYRVGHVTEGDFIKLDAEGREALEERMDRYFNNRLDMFPFVEQSSLPAWFHSFYEGTIEDRFPDDQDLRHLISQYRERFRRAIWGYVFLKRGTALAAMVAILLPVFVAPMLDVVKSNAAASAAIVLAWCVFVGAAYFGAGEIVFRFYRQTLSIESSNLSRVIVQRTADLQRVFLALKAKVDLDETSYGDDGEQWGIESARLMRLLMWVAKRLEYIEKFIQAEMWRVRRQRYWGGLGGVSLSIALALVMTLVTLAIPTPEALRLNAVFGIPLGSLGVKTLMIAAILALAAASYLLWRTPIDMVRMQLKSESWIRFGDLQLDEAIGDQVKRDKARLVEYRTLNRGAGVPSHHR